LGSPPQPVASLESLSEDFKIQTKKLLLDESYDVPDLQELIGKDFEKKLSILEKFPYPGGETVALQRLSKYISHEVSFIQFNAFITDSLSSQYVRIQYGQVFNIK